jgi:hypothetical protein
MVHGELFVLTAHARIARGAVPATFLSAASVPADDVRIWSSTVDPDLLGSLAHA